MSLELCYRVRNVYCNFILLENHSPICFFGASKINYGAVTQFCLVRLHFLYLSGTYYVYDCLFLSFFLMGTKRRYFFGTSWIVILLSFYLIMNLSRWDQRCHLGTQDGNAALFRIRIVFCHCREMLCVHECLLVEMMALHS